MRLLINSKFKLRTLYEYRLAKLHLQTESTKVDNFASLSRI